MIGVCKLCDTKKKLIRRSHVIPKFMEDGIKDETGTFVVSTMRGQPRQKKMQTGFCDSYILCQDCDNRILGKLERYLASVLVSNSSTNRVFKIRRAITPEAMHLLEVRFLDYEKLKLAVLSMLWRAHISNNLFYSIITINDHVNVIKEMILKGHADGELKYRIALFALTFNEQTLNPIIAQPRTIQGEFYYYCVFIIGGIAYYIELEYQKENVVFKNHLREDGSITIPVLDGLATLNLIKAFYSTSEAS